MSEETETKKVFTDNEEQKRSEISRNNEEQIEIDLNTAFSLKLQEFDKKIADAEVTIATLKRDKVAYILDSNIQQITNAYREKKVRQQLEEETKRKLSMQVGKRDDI
ncbi:MAG: hypothetical protein PHF86_04790 [Candidatus Nanoarchaeia archaeon]|nr:hypothetical protein [Candidatus Nanoarchaeia archaeon]